MPDDGQGVGPIGDHDPDAFMQAPDGMLESEWWKFDAYTRALIKTDGNELRKRLARNLNSTYADMFVGVVCLVNLLFVCQETDYRARGEPVPTWVLASSYGLVAVFAVELALRMYVLRRDFFRINGNLVDFAIVVADMGVIAIDGISKTVGLPRVSVLRLLRLARLFKVIRSLENFKEFDTIMRGVGGAIRAMAGASFLLAIVLTIWSIFAVEIFHPLVLELEREGKYDGCERCSRAFASVFQANLTFISQLLAGDSWGAVMVPLLEHYPLSGILAMLILFSVCLVLLNLVMAAIVDATAQARTEDADLLLREKARGRRKAKASLERIVRSIDNNGDGTISLDELSGSDNPELHAALKMMDMDNEQVETIFRVLDSDGSGKIAYDEFIEQMYKLTTMDSHAMLVMVRLFVQETILTLQEHISASRVVTKNGVSGSKRSLTEPLADTPVSPERPWPTSRQSSSPRCEGALNMQDVMRDADDMRVNLCVNMQGANLMELAKQLEDGLATHANNATQLLACATVQRSLTGGVERSNGLHCDGRARWPVDNGLFAGTAVSEIDLTVEEHGGGKPTKTQADGNTSRRKHKPTQAAAERIGARRVASEGASRAAQSSSNALSSAPSVPDIQSVPQTALMSGGRTGGAPARSQRYGYM